MPFLVPGLTFRLGKGAALLLASLVLTYLDFPLLMAHVVSPVRQRLSARETVDATEGFRNWRLDPNGVPIVDWNGRSVHHPLHVLDHGEAALARAAESGRTAEALNVYRWLKDALVVAGDAAYVPYDFDWEINGCTAPWKSALAQGRALSFLRRLKEANLVNGVELAVQARLIGNSFLVPYEAGGIYVTAGSCPGRWYLEYPCDAAASRKDFVLDGFLYALIGLDDYARAFRVESGRAAFEQGVAALKCLLPSYDVDNWSLYDLERRITSPKGYHSLQTDLLGELARRTNDPELQRFWRVWQGHRYRKRFPLGLLAKSKTFYSLVIGHVVALGLAWKAAGGAIRWTKRSNGRLTGR